jgi:hypothetical protein
MILTYSKTHDSVETVRCATEESIDKCRKEFHKRGPCEIIIASDMVNQIIINENNKIADLRHKLWCERNDEA